MSQATSLPAKSFLASKTIWMLVASFIGLLLQIGSKRFPALASINPDDLVAYLMQFGGLVGAGMARTAATQPLAASGTTIKATTPILLTCLMLVGVTGCASKDPVTVADKSTITLSTEIDTADGLLKAKLISPATAQKLYNWEVPLVAAQHSWNHSALQVAADKSALALSPTPENQAALDADSATLNILTSGLNAAVAAYQSQVANAKSGKPVSDYVVPIVSVPAVPATRP